MLKKERKYSIIGETRAGCKDVFNAYMCKNAIFSANDMLDIIILNKSIYQSFKVKEFPRKNYLITF